MLSGQHFVNTTAGAPPATLRRQPVKVGEFQMVQPGGSRKPARHAFDTFLGKVHQNKVTDTSTLDKPRPPGKAKRRSAVTLEFVTETWQFRISSVDDSETEALERPDYPDPGEQTPHY